MDIIADNYKRIQDNIANACARAGRSEAEITLMAVTKFVPKERIAVALDLGIDCVGENRVQEYIDKRDFFKKRECDIHFIGQLQTNKVKYIIGDVDVIQSVDRLSLIDELERQAIKKGLVQDIFIEVNIGGEAQKGGVSQEELMPLLSQLQGKPLRVKGLMCIPPALGSDGSRPYFALMRELFERCGEYADMEHLSMGMSGDYAAAIEEGSTMIRLGTALFGSRI